MSAWIEDVVLEGQYTRLEPMAAHHANGLYEAGRDPSIWTWMPRRELTSDADALGLIESALRSKAHINDFPFVIIDRASGRVAGSTRFLAVRREDRGVEIGWTWLAREFQRTRINTECKLLLLTHAFEVLRCIRVEFKTDHLNLASQRALERIGAVREGVFRQHRVRPDGTLRDSVYYSILDSEWPAVRARLSESLAR